MAFTRATHPLELAEVAYLWGDFTSPSAKATAAAAKATTATATLPFSFSYSIAHPLHILEKMNVDVYAALDTTEQWVLNTLAAKFRGTASARLSTRDGRPEVCAVHPLWCLANHSCEPNARWEWGGAMRFWARRGGRVGRDKDADGDGASDGDRGGDGAGDGERNEAGIKAGDEISTTTATSTSTSCSAGSGCSARSAGRACARAA